MRGEYEAQHWEQLTAEELPPRARRIPIIDAYEHAYYGTTSACAENTGLKRNLLSLIRNYLRVRGEYQQSPYP